MTNREYLVAYMETRATRYAREDKFGLSDACYDVLKGLKQMSDFSYDVMCQESESITNEHI